ncbi:MAG: TonB family protein [Candidatus Omnitrophica bacterium]|nr:TonB family protein [Candidatus Omnitrophota bacterium]
MFFDRIFLTAFLLSFGIHGIILLQYPGFNILSKNKNPDKIEISYVKAPKKKMGQPQQKATLSKNDPFLKLPQKISAKKITPPPFTDNENIFKKGDKIVLSAANLPKPAFSRPDSAAKKKISLPAVDGDKINNASYISYYQIVREKIRRTAYQNYTRTEIGEIYLSFIVSSEGYLREVRLVEEKSSADPYLRSTALRSIKEASPFPKFPKGLDYPQLSFNVIISFEIE